MKALFIVHGFPPLQHSGTFRSAAFARYLPNFGIQPVVICATDEPDVQVYGEAANSDDPVASCVVARVDWKLKASSRGAGQRIGRRFPLGWTFAQRRQYATIQRAVLPSVRRAISTEQPDVLYASAPPPVALMIAERVSRETGIPFVADLRDPWSYYSWARYRHYVDFLFERALERRVLSRAAAVLANTPCARRLLVDEVGIPEERVHVLFNGYDEADFAVLPHPSSVPRNAFEIIYTGLLSARSSSRSGWTWRIKQKLALDYSPIEQDPATRSPIFFLDAAAEVLRRNPEFRRWLRIRFVGAFDTKTHALFQAFPFPEILEISAPVPKQAACQLIAQADLGLLLQIEMKLRGRDCCTSIPGKLFDYLRTGVPILAAMQRGDATDLIEKLRAGVVVPPRDTGAIAAAIEKAVRDWLARGRLQHRSIPVGVEVFERRRLTEHLAAILKRAAHSD